MAIIFARGVYTVSASEADEDKIKTTGWTKTTIDGTAHFMTSDLDLVLPYRKHAVGITKIRLDRIAANCPR